VSSAVFERRGSTRVTKKVRNLRRHQVALRESQKRRIREAIRDHHLAFKVEVLGESSVTKRDLKRLKAKGLVPKSSVAVAKARAAVPAAHTIGGIAVKSGDDAAKKMDPDTFWEYIRHAPPRLTKHERLSMRATQNHVGKLITGIGETVLGVFDTTAYVVDQKLRRDYLFVVQEKVSESIADKKGLKEVASALRKVTGDAQRDWLRVAHTEMHNAMEEGRAHAISQVTPDDTDPFVFKRPRPDACKFCKLLYLDGKKPRLFRMSELSANGTNHGRKAKRPRRSGPLATQWKATVGSLHPWCQCPLQHMPEGFGFDKNGQMVFVGLEKAMRSEMTPVLMTLVGHTCD
jgi:hypothetical protein